MVETAVSSGATSEQSKTEPDSRGDRVITMSAVQEAYINQPAVAAMVTDRLNRLYDTHANAVASKNLVQIVGVSIMIVGSFAFLPSYALNIEQFRPVVATGSVGLVISGGLLTVIGFAGGWFAGRLSSQIDSWQQIIATGRTPTDRATTDTARSTEQTDE